MYGWLEPKVAKDGIRMLLLGTWGFWVALHGRQDQDDMAWRDRRPPLVPLPPLVKSAIRPDEEPLFGGGGATENALQMSDSKTRMFSAAVIE